MTYWTTFTPQKVSWELTTVLTQGKAGTGQWRSQLPLMKKSLKQLSSAGITGIRLVIFPEEVTDDGKKFHWEAIDTMLELCHKAHLKVDLCVGPFQFPNYPGIYLPKELLHYVYDNGNSLDTQEALREYGKNFLTKQMERYGDDKRIRGFHFANEWPDRQNVQRKEQIKSFISTNFMLWAAQFLASNTDKIISLNTNIDVSDKRKLNSSFGQILQLLGEQGRLGFDIYPSQETWGKAFFTKLKRIFEPYHESYKWSCSRFSQCEMYFCEVEAQPWGSGQSWYRMILEEENPNTKVLKYKRNSLEQTYEKYLRKSHPLEISLWGADFWLSAALMDITWPLDQVKALAKKKY